MSICVGIEQGPNFLKLGLNLFAVLLVVKTLCLIAVFMGSIVVASNAYGAPYAKNAHFRHGGFERFLLVGKHPKPFESQVPCELRTLWALEYCS